MDKKMNDALNEQIAWEYSSGYLYLAMAAYCAEKGLPGFSHWLCCQAQEELMHGTKIYNYILERSGHIDLGSIPAPSAKWANPTAIFKEGLKHEKLITSRINNLVDLAHTLKDHATTAFLQWFVTEQVEEESSFETIIQSLELIKGEGPGMFMMDKEMATRAATSISPLTNTATSTSA